MFLLSDIIIVNHNHYYIHIILTYFKESVQYDTDVSSDVVMWHVIFTDRAGIITLIGVML